MYILSCFPSKVWEINFLTINEVPSKSSVQEVGPVKPAQDGLGAQQPKVKLPMFCQRGDFDKISIPYHILSMVREGKYYAEKVIGHPNHQLRIRLEFLGIREKIKK